MPRDASGNYSLAPGNPVTPLTTIESTWANSTLDDIATALTGSLSRAGLGGMAAPLELIEGTESVPALNFGDDDTGFFGDTGEIHMTIDGTTAVSFTSAGITFDLPITLSDEVTVPGNINSKSTTADPTSDAAFRLENSAGDYKGGISWTGSVTVVEPASATDTLNINGVATFTSTAALKLPNGTTAERPGSPAAGDFRYNSSDGLPEIYTTAAGWQRMTAPIGSIMMYGGNPPPNGWLTCDGSAVSRTTYSALFSALSTTYGAGDGSTTFNLPDMRSRFPMGNGTGSQTDSFVDAGVDITNDTITVPSNSDKWVTGMAVLFTLSSGTITGLTSGVTYYIIRNSSTLVKLASTLANAQNGTAINMTAKSSPVGSLSHTYTARSRGDTGGGETHAMSSSELLSHGHTNQVDGGGSGGIQAGGTAGEITVSKTNANGGNAAMPIMNPYLCIAFIIKY